MAKLFPVSFRAIDPDPPQVPTISPTTQAVLDENLETDLDNLRRFHNLPPLEKQQWEELRPFLPNTNDLAELMASMRNGDASHGKIARYLKNVGETVGPRNVAYILSVPLWMDKGGARCRLAAMITLRLGEPLWGAVFERALEMVKSMSDDDAAYYFGVSGKGGIDKRNYKMNHNIACTFIFGDRPPLVSMAVIALIFPDCADIVRKLIDLGPVRFREEHPQLCRDRQGTPATPTTVAEVEDAFDDDGELQEDFGRESKERRAVGFFPPVDWFPWEKEYLFMDAREMSREDELLAIRTLAAILGRYTSVLYTTPDSVDNRIVQRYQKCGIRLEGVISRFAVVSRPLQTPAANAKLEQALIAMTRGRNLNMQPGGDGEGRRSARISVKKANTNSLKQHKSPFERLGLGIGLQNLARDGYIKEDVLASGLDVYGVNRVGYDEWVRVVRVVYKETGHPIGGSAAAESIALAQPEKSNALYIQAVGHDAMNHLTGQIIHTYPTNDYRSVDLLETPTATKLVTYPPSPKTPLNINLSWEWVSDMVHFLAAYTFVIQSSALEARERYGDLATCEEIMGVVGEYVESLFKEMPLVEDYILNLTSHFLMDNGTRAGVVQEALDSNNRLKNPSPMKQVIGDVLTLLSESIPTVIDPRTPWKHLPVTRTGPIDAARVTTYFTALSGAIACPYRSLTIFQFRVNWKIGDQNCRLTVSDPVQKLSEVLVEFERVESNGKWSGTYLMDAGVNRHFLATLRIASNPVIQKDNKSVMKMELSSRSLDPDFRASFRESLATSEVAADNKWGFDLPIAPNRGTKRRPFDDMSPNKRIRSDQSTSSTHASLAPLPLGIPFPGPSTMSSLRNDGSTPLPKGTRGKVAVPKPKKKGQSKK